MPSLAVDSGNRGGHRPTGSRDCRAAAELALLSRVRSGRGPTRQADPHHIERSGMRGPRMPRNLRRTADGPSTLGPRGRDVASEPGELQAGDAPVPESLEKASVKTSAKTSVKTIDALLELLRQKPPITRADVAVQVGRTVRAVEMASAKPVKAGRLRFAGGSDSARLPHAPESSGRNWGRLPRSGWDGICSRRMGVGEVRSPYRMNGPCELLPNPAIGYFEVILRLQIQPELGGGAEVYR